MAEWAERFNEGTGTYTYTSETFPGYEITWSLTKPKTHTVWAPVGIIGVKASFAEAEQHVVDDSALVGHATQINLEGR